MGHKDTALVFNTYADKKTALWDRMVEALALIPHHSNPEPGGTKRTSVRDRQHRPLPPSQGVDPFTRRGRLNVPECLEECWRILTSLCHRSGSGFPQPGALARAEDSMQTYEQQLSFLRAHNTAVMGHSNQSLLDHLVGVRSLLVDWGASDSLAAAGLFHSVYGTESFRQEAVPLALRPQVREVIGDQAEALAYLFGAMAKGSFDASVERGGDFAIDDRHTSESVPLDRARWSELCELVVANWLEQRPRVAPEYKQLKEEMFRKVVAWLSPAGAAALCAGYGFSQPGTHVSPP